DAPTTYAAGTNGPNAATELIERDARSWQEDVTSGEGTATEAETARNERPRRSERATSAEDAQ
ncbi:MAG TPA: hypothetical protein VK059_07265, partial [Nocardioidaceae bacterium]|nr:hypothetical protein [Nocardioidaceae bacterium]